MAWREGLAFSMGFPQGPLCSARPSPTLRSPSDRTLVWLPLFTLFLWEIMYYFPTPPHPLLGISNTEDISRLVLGNHLSPGVFTEVTSPRPLPPLSTTWAADATDASPRRPWSPHFCARSCQHLRPHAWGRALATQQAGRKCLGTNSPWEQPSTADCWKLVGEHPSSITQWQNILE